MLEKSSKATNRPPPTSSTFGEIPRPRGEAADPTADVPYMVVLDCPVAGLYVC
jgi:hypothetical protein